MLGVSSTRYGVSSQLPCRRSFYSVRVSHRLIQDIKVYAGDHRLSQSELVTIALQAYMRQP
jgi:hypothetical protein